MIAAHRHHRRRLLTGIAILGAFALLVASCGSGGDKAGKAPSATDSSAPGPTPPPGSGPAPPVTPVDGMPPVVDANNLYSEAGPGKVSPAIVGDPARVYVPSHGADQVTVIDPNTLEVVDTYYSGGANPQHAVPSYDMRTIWITNNSEKDNSKGTLMPIDPATGKPGQPVPADDPYNLYFTPDGRSAIVVAEALKRLDFRDPHTMELQDSLSVPDCDGLNHADFSIDGNYVIFTCEFNGKLVKIDWKNRKVLGMLSLSKGGMPQDIRVSPDGSVFYVAEMMNNGVYLVDGQSFTETGFIPTGVGTHGLYPSRDGTKLYVVNRGSTRVGGGPDGPGSVSVLDFATRKVETNWPVPGGGSPDMGNTTADGKQLWLAGRYDNEVYVFDTTTGEVLKKIPVASEPHGLTVWPQPGRYSLGHTGNTR